MARKKNDRAAASGPTGPLQTTAVWAKLVLDPSQERGAQASKWVAKDIPCPISSTLGLPRPVSFLIAKLGWEPLTAPLARTASQLLEAAA